MCSMWCSLLTAAALSASAYAVSCSTLGTSASDSFPGQFTFSLDSATETTTALHLVAFLTVPGTTYHALSTGTAPAVLFHNFTMTGGLITAVSPTPDELSPAQSLGAALLDSTDFAKPNQPTGFLMWINTLAPPSEIYCAIPRGDGTAVLALDGRTDLFALCQSDLSSTASNVQAVVYNATLNEFREGQLTYNGNTCEPITLLAVPL